jgi:hypothetical protein
MGIPAGRSRPPSVAGSRTTVRFPGSICAHDIGSSIGREASTMPLVEESAGR